MPSSVQTCPAAPPALRRRAALCLPALLAGAVPSLAAQQAPGFPAAEAAALVAKGQGRVRAARDAFLALTGTGDGSPHATAVAEYCAVHAEYLTRQLGDWGALRDAMDRRAAEAERHPALRDALLMLALAAELHAGEAAAAATRTRDLGFLTQWWIAGPFDNERGGGFDRAYEPETKVDLEARYDGKKREIGWRRVPVESPPGGVIDLDAMVRPNDQVLCYAVTAVFADRPQTLALRLGSDEAFKVFVNGAYVGGRDVVRPHQHDQDALAVDLREGPNLLLLKVCDQQGAFAFSARLTAPDGGKAAGLEERGDAASLAAAAAVPPAQQRSAPPLAIGAAAVLAETAPRDPCDAYRLGFILALRQSDDPTDRRDHRLASMAAAAMPDDPMVANLLAFTRIRPILHEAEKEENARRHDYERVLAKDPDHPHTLVALAQMELQSTGSLEAAESHLRRALARNPEFARARLLLAEGLSRRGLFELADREVARAAATPDGTGPEVQQQAAAALDRALDAERALEALRRAVAGRYAAPTVMELARALLRADQRQAAMGLLAEAERALPFEVEPRMLLARLQSAAGEHAAAAATLRRWLAICPEDDEALVELARVHGITGEAEQQREALRAALRFNENRKQERRYLEFLQSDETPFHAPYQVDGNATIAADPGPPADAAAANDPFYHLLEQTVVRAYRNGTTSTYRHSLVRVLTDRGSQMLGTHVVPHFPEEQRARLLLVRIVKKDGQEIRPKLEGDGDGQAPYWVRLPALAPGDVVEVASRVDDVAPTYFGDYFGLEHYFATGVPCQRSLLTLVLDKGRTYRIAGRNGAPDGAESVDAEGHQVVRWEMRDVPRSSVEEYQPDWKEHVPLVRVTTYADWDAFSSWWWNLIRKQTEVSPAMRAKVQELTANLDTEAEKIAALYRFVTTDVRYTAWEFGVHGYKPYSAPAIFERRHGDCKDKSILLNALLSEIGVPAFPVLIFADPRRSADDLSLPLVHHFNHCISYLPEAPGRRAMFLDGTATYHPPDTLPEMDAGAKVLVVREGRGDVLETPWPDAEANVDARDYRIELERDGDARMRLLHQPRLNHAVAVREGLGNEPAKRKEKLERELAEYLGKVEIREITTSELLDLDVPVEVTVEVAVPEFAGTAGDAITLKASLRPGALLPLAAMERRSLPLLLGPPTTQASTLRYVLPPEYEAVSTPADVELSTNFGSYALRWRVADGTVTVERRLTLSSPRIEPPEYEQFREFAAHVDQADRQVVEAKRKGGAR
jgi:tetratricopeptide (TPR) repeat protein